jgi:protein O-mannosyl-transferase
VSKSSKRKQAVVAGRHVAAVRAPASDAATAAPIQSRTPARFAAIAVFVLTFLVLRPALDGAWLDWDDAPLLRDHEAWRGLSLGHLRWMFTTFHMGPYQPLSWLSYALDHAFWGMDPAGYHLTNLLLHAGSASCLFFVARRLFALALETEVARGARVTPASIDAAAVLAALFWSIHPLRVESVAWITERRDCLSGLFFLWTILAWLKHLDARDRRTERRWYWLAVLAFALSLLAKGLGMVLPLVLLVLDVWPLGRHAQLGWLERTRVLVLEKWPFFVLSLAAAVLAFVGQSVTGAMVDIQANASSARLAQAFYGLCFYVRKTLWPSNLMVLYPMGSPFHPNEWRFVAAEIAVVLALAALVVFRRRVPALAAALFSYALIVAPVLGLVQIGSQLVADRYSYLSGLPLCILGAGALLVLAARVNVLLLGAGVLALVPLGLASQKQLGVWHDTLSLWQHDLAIDPTDSPGRRNLIAAWEDKGRAGTDPAQRRACFDKALAECQRGMELAPDAACLSNAAKIYDLLASDEPARRQHYLELALDSAQRAVDLVRRTGQRLPDAFESHGVILSELGRPAEAVASFEQMARWDTTNSARQGMLGEALMQVGRTREALAPLEAAHRLAPDSVPILLDLGDAHRLLGERDAAIEAYRRVLALKRQALGAAAEKDAEFGAAEAALAELGQSR